MTYDMAMATCHNESAQLASFADRYQEAYAKTVLYNNRLQAMWIGLKADEVGRNLNRNSLKRGQIWKIIGVKHARFSKHAMESSDKFKD